MRTQFDDVSRGYTGCVYVAELATGVVKVGFSANPKTRLYRLSNQVKRQYGTTICRYYISVNMPKRLAQKAETVTLTNIRNIGVQVDGTHEYFHGVKFSDAVALIELLHVVTPETTEKAAA